MDILTAIKERRSVRTFNGEPLSDSQKAMLEKAIAESTDPFGGKVTIRLRQFDLRGGFKPSTYGFIKGASDFFLLGIGGDDASALSAGFRFEQVVLEAWQEGLGTCWIAATFKGSDFDRGETWAAGEELKIICPVGEAANKSLKEKMMRLAVGSDRRKPFDSMFFHNDFNTSVPSDNRFRESLEMLRLAPSSTNSQPWRALVCGDTVHFYCKPKSPASVLDTGIGICHFAETEKFYGRKGEFHSVPDAPVPPENWKYLTSYSGV